MAGRNAMTAGKADGPHALRVLMLEDSVLDEGLVAAALEKGGLRAELRRVWTREDFEAGLAEKGLDLVLSDYDVPGFDGMQALELARRLRPEVPFLFVSGVMGEEF